MSCGGSLERLSGGLELELLLLLLLNSGKFYVVEGGCWLFGLVGDIMKREMPMARVGPSKGLNCCWVGFGRVDGNRDGHCSRWCGN